MRTTSTRAAAAAAGLAITAVLVTSCSQAKETPKESASNSGQATTSAAATTASSAAESPAAAKNTLFYPTREEALFSIEAPADWTVGKIEEAGDFGSIESPNGSVLEFRAQKFETDAETDKEVDSIVESTLGFLNENYHDVQLDEPKSETMDGQPGSQLTGTGKDKDGNAVKFLSAMIALGPNTLAEVWAAVFPEGNKIGRAHV